MRKRNLKKTNEEFIKEAKEAHGDKYDYSKVEYINANTKVCIICPEHGEFWQTPHNHLSNKTKCPNCCKNHNKYTKEKFLKLSNDLHGDKYDYSKVEYVNNCVKVCIICHEHGEFWQTPSKHLSGQGCPKCGIKTRSEKNKLTKEEFIRRAKEIHGNKYDYSNVEYINCNTKVCIMCPEHGKFWQTPHHHINNHGCPVCNFSKLENEIKIFLTEHNIKFISQYKGKWLGKQSLDFYLPDYNVAIECQGIQHFIFDEHFGDEKKFLEAQKRDILKREKCLKNNIKLLYYSNLNIKFPYLVYKNKDELLRKITRKKK